MDAQTYTILGSDGEVLWQAQEGPQQELFNNILDPNNPPTEICFGGARGGGKSSAAIAVLTLHIDKPGYRGLILRKTAESLREFVDTAWALYEQMGARKVGNPVKFVWPNGATIYTRHFADERSLEQVKGHEYHIIVLEEGTQVARETMYEQLLGSNRSTVPGIRPMVLMTTNPDGVGHLWVKRRFVDVTAGGKKIPPMTRFTSASSKRIRIFIPARVQDNKILMDRDPGYLDYLQGIENEALRKAWLLGDWDCLDGAFFPEFRPNGPYAGEPEHARHVIEAGSYHIPEWCHRWAALDWGFAHHAAAYWGAIAPDRRAHVYREMVVRNVGAEELGAEFAKRSMPDLEAAPDSTITLYLSHDAFSQKNEGKTVAELFRLGIERIIGPGSCYMLALSEDERKVKEFDTQRAADMFTDRFEKMAGKARIVLKRSSRDPVAAANVVREYFRWRSLVERLEPDMNYARTLLEKQDGYQKYTAYLAKFEAQQDLPPLPRVLIHSNCTALIQTIPVLVADPSNLEKVKKFNGDDKTVGDDPWDAFAYLMMGAREQQNDLPYREYMAREVLKHLGSNETDINLKIQVARQAHERFNRQNNADTVISFPRDSVRMRWQN